jgi:hypothetical protein
MGYVDTDWANDINDQHSISGSIFILSGAAISWSSQKQKVVAQSSTEAKYISGASGTNEAIWLRQLLTEMDHRQDVPTNLLIDNQGAIALTSNPVFHKRTKHIEVRFHHMCHHFDTGDILPIYIPTGDQVADALTKALPRATHIYHVKGMGLLSGSPP